MNYFIEGLQGSGKSTLVRQMAERHKGYTAFREGDYSPADLAWCAWMSNAEYEKVLEKYPSLREEMNAKTVTEGAHKVMPYTQILTDVPGFHKDMEQYEIYNGRISWDEFREIVLRRFEALHGTDQIFECAVFQNIVEDMLLFRVMEDEEIVDFYREVYAALEGKDYRILYLATEDVEQSIAHIRRERSDENGNELWFPMMVEYFNSSPYAKETNKAGAEELMNHLRHRQELELRLCREVFGGKAIVLKAKEADVQSIGL